MKNQFFRPLQIALLAVSFAVGSLAAQSKVPEIAVDTVWAATAATDIGLSQSCFRSHQCHEGNPLMPSSAAGAIAVGGGESLLSAWEFHHWRKTHPKLAWMIPAANITAHGLGVWSFARPR